MKNKEEQKQVVYTRSGKIYVSALEGEVDLQEQRQIKLRILENFFKSI